MVLSVLIELRDNRHRAVLPTNPQLP